MRSSRQLVFAVLGLSLGSTVWAAGPVSSDLPKPTSPMNPLPPMTFGGAMASGSASSSGNGNGQTSSKAQVQIGGLPQFNGIPNGTVSSDLPTMPGFPANMLPINAVPFGNPAVANPVGMNRRVVATANGSEDKITTGADDQYSTVIKVKPNGQITMIVVLMDSMEVRRIQVKNVEELQKKDKLAFTEYQKYFTAE